LIWAVAYGALVFDRVPPAALWFGAPLIMFAGLLVAWREHRLKVGASVKEREISGVV
jgi:drug/metabolite transporter (DMT)-like permease